MSKRFLVFLLVMVLCLSVGMAPASAAVRLVYLSNVNVDTEGYDINESPYVQYLRDTLDVDLEIISDATNYNQKVATVMASGDLPDYVMLGNRQELSNYAEQGLLMDISDMIQNYPNLMDQISDLAWELCSYDGSVYGIPLLRYDQTPIVSFVNKTFAANLEIDLTTPKTIDDWYDMLYQFTYNDPDQNGEQDTIGAMSTGGESLYSFVGMAMLDAFDAATSRIVDGEYVPYFLSENYKEYLKYMSKLYADGLIDPEFLVTTGGMPWDKFTTDKYGMFTFFWMTTELRSKGYDTGNIVAIPPPLREDGTQGRNRYASPIRTYIAITKDCENPEKVLEIMDWGCSEAGGIFVLGGIEGLDYTILEDGSIDILPERRGKNTSLRFILLGTQKPKIDTPVLEDLLVQAFGEASLEALKTATEYGMYDELELLAPYFPELAMYDLNTPVYEFRDKAIMGLVDVDAEWDNYVAGWLKAGGEERIRLMTEWYHDVYAQE